jgi:hypothetical protein
VKPEWRFDLALRQCLTDGLHAFVEVANLTGARKEEITHKTNGEIVKNKENVKRNILLGLNYRF